MDKTRLNTLINELSTVTPPYAYNCKEFIPGKTPVYYSGPYWDSAEMEAILKAVLTGAWITSGAQVEKFQRKFSQKFNVKQSHMVNSGSSANLVMIAALKKRLGWKDGDEVIVSPVGFPTTIAPLVQNGLKPVFIDIEMNTLNFDLTKMEEKFTERTVAIFVSPVLGNPCNLDYIKNTLLLQKYEPNSKNYGKDIKLIGDNCDSLGSRWNGDLITDHYYAWSCSFYPAHHISTGEGGMVCSNDEELINEARSISWWGRDCKCVGAANLLPCGSCGNRFDTWLGSDQGIVDHKYVFSNMGYNLKPLDLQGAIGCVQLDKMDEIDRLRRENKIRFQKLLEKYVPGIRIAHHNAGADPSWFGVPIIMPDAETKTRFVKFLEDNKIQTRNYFAGNILVHPGYKHLDDYTKYPNSNKVMGTVFFVGCPPHYNDDVFNYIESVLVKWNP